MREFGEVFLSDRTFFISDTHFFHKNIIDHCKRPFNDVEAMNKHLIEVWNDTVRTTDTVFHLGDFSLTAPAHKIVETLKKLKGNKYLVLGNHDEELLKSIEARRIFKGIYDILDIRIVDDYNKHIVLCHYPITSWNKKRLNSLHLHGHMHGTLKEQVYNRIDVGVDCNENYKPISYKEVKQKILNIHNGT